MTQENKIQVKYGLTLYEWFFIASISVFTIFQIFQIVNRDPRLLSINADFYEYLRLSKNFFSEIKTNGVCIDRINRLLPLLLCYLWGLLSGSQLNDLYVLDFFLWGNLLFTLVSVFIFYRLSLYLNLSDSTRLIGFFLLFVNFIVARHFFTNPILTDSLAFLMAWITTYAYIRSNTILLILSTLFGSFCWPTALLPSAFLILFPSHYQSSSTTQGQSGFNSKWLFVSINLILILWVRLNPVPSPYFNENRFQFGLATLIALVYLEGGIQYFSWIPPIQEIKNHFSGWIESLGWTKLSLCIFFISLPPLLIKLISTFYGTNPYGASSLLDNMHHIWGRAVYLPGLFVVNHIYDLGLFPVLVALNFKNISQVIRNFGFGAICFVVLFLVFSLNFETRHLIYCFPILGVSLCIELDKQGLKGRHVLGMGVIAIISSRCWKDYQPAIEGDTHGTIVRLGSDLATATKLEHSSLQHLLTLIASNNNYVLKIGFAIVMIFLGNLFWVRKSSTGLSQ